MIYMSLIIRRAYTFFMSLRLNSLYTAFTTYHFSVIICFILLSNRSFPAAVKSFPFLAPFSSNVFYNFQRALTLEDLSKIVH